MLVHRKVKRVPGRDISKNHPRDESCQGEGVTKWDIKMDQ